VVADGGKNPTASKRELGASRSTRMGPVAMVERAPSPGSELRLKTELTIYGPLPTSAGPGSHSLPEPAHRH
jgi:hypothetical protein